MGVKLDIQCLLNRKHDILNLGYTVVFQNLGIGHGDINPCYSHSWGVQVVESWTWKPWEERYKWASSRGGTLTNKIPFAYSPQTQETQILTLHDSGTNLCTNTKLGPATLNSHKVICLHHTGLNGLHIQGSDGAQINNLWTWWVKTKSLTHSRLLKVSNGNLR